MRGRGEVQAPLRHLERDRVTWWAYAVLAAFAFVLNGFGPVVLEIRDELGLSRTVTGLHSTAMAVGVLLSGVAGEALRRRGGWARVLWTGTGLLAAGVVGLGVFGTVALTLPSALLIGFGGTLLLTMVPGVLSAHHGPASGALTSEAHSYASLVGVVAPLTVGASLALFGAWLPAFALVTVVVLPLLAVRRPPLPEAPRAAEPADGAPGRLPGAYWRWWTALLFGVAVEFSVLLWAADDAEERLGLSSEVAPVAPAAFLLGMATSRGLGAKLLLGERTDRVFRAAAVFAAAAFLVWRASDAVPVALVGCVLIGLGTGLLYPSSLARAMAAAPALEALASTRSAIASGLAIGLGPLALGALADAEGIATAVWIIPALLACAAAATAAAPRSSGTGS